MGSFTKIAVAVALLFCSRFAFSQQMRLGKNPYAVEKSAVLELYSDNQGLLLPRIADTSLINVMNPPDGMVIYFIPSQQLLFRSNGSWQKTATIGSVVTSLNGNTGALTMDTSYIAGFFQKVRSLFANTGPITYSNGLIGITQAGTLSSGYLSSTDWNTFNNKASAFSSGNLIETGSGILTITGGTGSVIGLGTTIQVKQANTTQGGYLSSTDWNTFNSKLSSIDTGNIANFWGKVRSLFSGTAPITYANGAIGITQANTATNGYLSSTDWNTFNSKGSGSVTSVSVATANGVSGIVATPTTTPAITLTLGNITPTSVAATGTVTGSNLSGTNTGNVTLGTANGLSISGQALSLGTANSTTTGALSSTDWNTFNNKASAFSSGNLIETGSGILTITGGTGSVIGLGTTIQVKQANTTQGGYLSSTDWNTFNSKLSSIDTGNIANFWGKVRSLFSGTAPITYANGAIGITQANTATNGYLSSTDWNTFNSKGSGSVTSVSVATANGVSGIVATPTTTPAITLTLGNITPTSVAATGTVTGSNLSGTNTGNVTLGTANGLSISGQALSLGTANSTTTGALSSTDWNTFNNKASAFSSGNLIETGSGILTITGGTGSVIGLGTTIQVKQANTTQGGYLSSTDWNTFNSKLSSIDTGNIANFWGKVRSLFSGTAPITYANGAIGITQANTATNGYLSSTDWNTFNSKGSGSVTSVSVATANGVSGIVATPTTTPAITLTLGNITPTSVAATGTVTGSNLSGTNTGNVTLGTANGLSISGQALSLGTANSTTTGALSSTDWNTFNNKASAFSSGNLIETGSGILTITGGTGSVIGLGTTIQVKQANTTQGGYLSSTDWNTFNSKLSSIDTGNIANFWGKVRSLFSGTAPITYANGAIGITQANTTTNGYLSSTDWNTFNSKGSGSVTSVSVATANGVSGIVATPTTTPAITLTLGNITPTSVAATGTVTGSNLSGTNTGNVTLGTANGLSISGQALSLGTANSTTTGALSSTDWNTFNNKASAFSSGNLIETGSGILTITGGTGSVIGLGTTIQVKQANTTQGGYLSSTDWNTFNSKLSSIDTGNIANFWGKVRSLFSGTAPITYANGAIGITQANTTTNGYLSSTDWNTFNNKAGASNVWLLNGNGGTNPTTNFIGTTDNQDVVFKANNTEWARIVSSSGDWKIGSSTSGTVRSTDELVMRQDGDVYGSSILRLRNRTAENGAIFETTDPTTTLVDFIFKTAASQRNIRYEARSTYARAGTPSFHIGGSSPDNPTLAVGDTYAAFNTNLKIGNYTTPTEALDVTGNMRFSGAIMPNNLPGTSGQVLASGGAGSSPTWVNFKLSALGDVVLTTPANGQILKFNGTNWVNSAVSYLSDPGANGILARTAANTIVNRTIAGTTNKITVTNGDGVGGNPTIAAGSDIVDETMSNTYTGGSKQTFVNSGTTAGFNLTPSADPSTLATGDIWGSTTTANSIKYRDAAGTTRTLLDLSLPQTLTNKLFSGSTNTLGNVTMTMGSDATGDIYYRNSSGILTRLGIGTTGQFLSVSGGLPAWSSSTVTAHNLLSTTHSDVTAASVQRGDIITGQGTTAKWTRLGIGAQGTMLQAGANEVGYTSFKLPTTVGTAGQQLRSDGTDYVNKTTTTYQATPADPNSTASTTGVMMGLSGSITPGYSGTIMVIISGDMDNTTNGEGTITQIRYGTGAAPANAVSLKGTAVGSKIKMGQNNKNNVAPFTCNAVISGLTVGTTYWIDLSLAATGGTAEMQDLSISIVEL